MTGTGDDARLDVRHPGGPPPVHVGADIAAALAAAGDRRAAGVAAQRRSYAGRTAFIGAPTTPGLEQLGQSFAIVDTSPLDPAIQISPDIGAATGLEFLGQGQVLAAAEPVRRGGGSAGVVHPSG